MAVKDLATDDGTATVVIEDRGALIDHLNSDLAGELQAIIMYLQYSAMLRGLHRRELRGLFQSELPDEQRHARLLADKIAVLGGTPATIPRPVPRAVSAYQMLRNIYEAEARAVADYTDRAIEAASHGEIGLKVDLEGMLADETRHRDEVEQILSGWNQPIFETRST
ncbi:MAG TPA: ferritin-like domain-containing protein [Planctomycetaceae bacterium]|nr:ferritin-like domain-containing protein [Planctomycetaceae bacterium]